MYNHDVAQDHTFMVGDDQWIVHNKCSNSLLAPGGRRKRWREGDCS